MNLNIPPNTCTHTQINKCSLVEMEVTLSLTDHPALSRYLKTARFGHLALSFSPHHQIGFKENTGALKTIPQHQESILYERKRKKCKYFKYIAFKC